MKVKLRGLLFFILILILVLSTLCVASLGWVKSASGYEPTYLQSYGLNDRIFDKGYGTDNNGVAKFDETVKRLLDVKPSERQLAFQELEYYNFIHFGLNTFTGNEWGEGKDSPSIFNPLNLNTDQWCSVLKESGSKGIILTAKHHDGFGLWDSAFTDYDIASSPYKNGKGDIVAELAESCKKFGMKFGIYLSPWDRHEPTYGKNSYNDFFINQLTELLTNYGDIFSVWFDGARGEDAVIDADFDYDFERYYALIRKLQPNAVITVVGPDVRWVGNEAGVSRESEWSVVKNGSELNQEFQVSPKDAERLQKVSYDSTDIGSRDLLKNFKNLQWHPAEVDVSIRKGWFFHENQQPKSLDHLLNIYYKAVGGNSSLLLNIPPNKDGLIDDLDVKRLREFGNKISKSTASKINVKETKVGTAKDKMTSNKELSNLNNEEMTSYISNQDEYIYDFKFDKKQKIQRLDLREDTRFSQRVEYFDVYFKANGRWHLVAKETNIGNRRIVRFNPLTTPKTDEIRIVIRQSRHNPVLRSVMFYN